MSSHRLLNLVDKRDFRTLFIEELGWDNPDHTDVHHKVDGTTYTLTNIASFKGLRIWHCPQLPPRPVQRQIDVLVGQDTLERLVIFTSGTKQEWRWPRRSQLGAANAKLLTHPYIPGDSNYRTLAQRLEAIELDFDEDISLVTLLDRMRTEFDQEAETASAQAARLMGGLYTELEAAGVDEHDATLLLARLLFLLFGDDAAMWTPAGLFETYLRNHTTDETLHTDLADLFAVLDTDEKKRNLPQDSPYRQFRYINGGLFKDPQTFPPLASAFRELLLQACTFDWSIISPAIFGGMFQTVKSKEARREAGEHYTSETNILKTIGPLFLDEYRTRLDKAKNSNRELTKLHNDLGELQYLDPACGCGNFLIVAYREMRALELEILKLRRDLDLADPALGPAQRAQLSIDVSSELRVRLDQFHGFEISEWPARIAETAMLLVDHLANQQMAEEFGMAPDRLPITISAHIHHVNALEVDWNELLPSTSGSTYVFGNPPFLGHDSRTKKQSDELRKVWGTKSIGRLDYVTGWHAKSLNALANRAGEFAYVATNSISQGDQVPRLFEPLQKAGWRIKFAHRTFAWDSQAPGKAAVHCVVVGYTRDDKATPRLWDYDTPLGPAREMKVRGIINAYLVDGPDILIKATQKQLNPSIPRATFGSTPRAGDIFTVTEDQYDDVMADPVAAKYVRPFIGAEELLHNKRRWCLWLVDLDPADINRSPVLKARIAAVKKWREESESKDANDAAATPHLFWWISQPNQPYLCIPSVVSESRPFFIAAPQAPEVITSNLAFTAPDPDGFAFALVSSSMFLTWQRATGGRLKSDVRFSSSLTWNNFPLPDVDDSTRAAICQAGADILDVRAKYPELTLAEAYHPLEMKSELIAAHYEVDLLVDRIFGENSRVTSEKRRLEILMGSYANLAGTSSPRLTQERNSSRTRTKKGASETALIRKWARDNGHAVSARGRLSEDLVRAYRASVSKA